MLDTAAVYLARRVVLVSVLRRLGWDVHCTKATVFVWARLPEVLRSRGSLVFGRGLLEEKGVAVCPGAGFDIQADEYLRFALVESEQKLRIALERIEQYTRAL